MFSRQRQLLTTAVFVLDGVLISGAWVAAYWLRFHALNLPAPLGIPPLSCIPAISEDAEDQQDEATETRQEEEDSDVHLTDPR